MYPQKSRPANPHLQPNQVEMQVTNPPQPEQVEMPPEYELIELDIPEDIPELINVPEQMLSDFDVWAHSVLDYK